ncbi:hypothetical protein [Fervidobacterium sp.]
MRNVLRVLISFITVYSSILFPSGVFYSVLNSEGTAWTQILTFTVKQVVRVEWSYDESTPVPIDPESSLGTVGLVSITSNKKFKFFVMLL